MLGAVRTLHRSLLSNLTLSATLAEGREIRTFSRARGLELPSQKTSQMESKNTLCRVTRASTLASASSRHRPPHPFTASIRTAGVSWGEASRASSRLGAALRMFWQLSRTGTCACPLDPCFGSSHLCGSP